MRCTQKAAFGGVSPNDSTRDYGFMHKKTSGAQYDMVTGYSGTADIALAIERGEIDGACGWDWASFKSQRPDWIRDKKVNMLLQDALEPNEELTKMGVPSVWKYVTSDDNRKVVSSWSSASRCSSAPTSRRRTRRRSSSPSCARPSTPP